MISEYMLHLKKSLDKYVYYKEFAKCTGEFKETRKLRCIPNFVWNT